MKRKDRCKSWAPHPADDWVDGHGVLKRDDGLHDPPSSELGDFDFQSKTLIRPREDERNQIPQWIMCADPAASYIAVISRAQIINAIAAAMQRFQTYQQTPPFGLNDRQYPTMYRANEFTPPTLHADRKSVHP